MPPSEAEVTTVIKAYTDLEENLVMDLALESGYSKELVDDVIYWTRRIVFLLRRASILEKDRNFDTIYELKYSIERFMIILNRIPHNSRIRQNLREEDYKYLTAPLSWNYSSSQFGSPAMSSPTSPDSPANPSLNTYRSIVTLYIDVASPRKVTVNEPFDLAVLVRSPRSQVLKIDDLEQVKTEKGHAVWPEGEPYISLFVRVRAASCTIYDGDIQRFRLYHKISSPVLLFQMVAKMPGLIRVYVEIRQEEEIISSSMIRTEAMEKLVGEVRMELMTFSVEQESDRNNTLFYPVEIIEEIGHTELLLEANRRRLQKLEVKKAQKGINTAPEDLNEIEDIELNIKKLVLHLQKIKRRS